MAHRDLVVVAASAGGLEPLRTLVSGLPEDFPAAILVVMHIPAQAPSALPSILARSSRIPVSAAKHGEELRGGHVYVAPPDHHLVVLDDEVILTHGPRENGHRPAADPLFRSAAVARGTHAIGLVLSGALDDGTAGMAAIRSRGGTLVVQDPEDALHPSMPRTVLETVGADHVADAAELAGLLVRLCAEELPVATQRDVDELDRLLTDENRMTRMDPSVIHQSERPGRPAGLSCPDCNGTLYELTEDPELLRYRCRVGHAWSPDSLLAQQAGSLESALWVALRTLEDKAALAMRLAYDADERGRGLSAERFRQSATETHRAAESIRTFLSGLSGPEASLS